MYSGFSIKRLVMAIAFAVISTSVLIGCSEDESSAPVVSHVGTYRYQNGACFDDTNRQVSINFCQNSGVMPANTTSNGFSMVNGACIYTQTGQQVDPMYCQQPTSTPGTCNGVVVPGYGCLPRGNCQAPYASYHGNCVYVGG
jgi:hypothetical protein